MPKKVSSDNNDKYVIYNIKSYKNWTSEKNIFFI